MAPPGPGPKDGASGGGGVVAPVGAPPRARALSLPATFGRAHSGGRKGGGKRRAGRERSCRRLSFPSAALCRPESAAPFIQKFNPEVVCRAGQVRVLGSSPGNRGRPRFNGGSGEPKPRPLSWPRKPAPRSPRPRVEGAPRCKIRHSVYCMAFCRGRSKTNDRIAQWERVDCLLDVTEAKVAWHGRAPLKYIAARKRLQRKYRMDFP